MQIHIPAGQRLGGKVIDTEHVRKGYGERLLIEDLSFSLPPAGIVGVIGANGAGKTTLFRMLVGDEKPDAGTVELGETVDLAYVDQSRDSLDPDKNVWEEISEGYDNIKVGDREMNSRAYVAGFNFKGSDQQKKVGSLSGGERNRVHLAKLLRRGGNVLLLDEPTNDLDVDTLRALEEALLAFPGCAVIISHDRWFLDRVATHVLAFEGDSQVTWFEGNFEAYEEWRHERLGRRGRPAAPHHLQEAHPRVSARCYGDAHGVVGRHQGAAPAPLALRRARQVGRDVHRHRARPRGRSARPGGAGGFADRTLGHRARGDDAAGPPDRSGVERSDPRRRASEPAGARRAARGAAIAGRLAYVDTSAFVKLPLEEIGHEPLRRALDSWDGVASSALLSVEAVRASARYGAKYADRARASLDRTSLIPIDDSVLQLAADLEPAALRTLDAIHLATALSLGPALGAMFVYDKRLRDAAEAAGLAVEAPA